MFVGQPKVMQSTTSLTPSFVSLADFAIPLQLNALYLLLGQIHVLREVCYFLDRSVQWNHRYKHNFTTFPISKPIESFQHVSFFVFLCRDVPLAKNPSTGTAQQRLFLVLKVVLHAVVVSSEILRLSTKSRCSCCCRAHLYSCVTQDSNYDIT